MPDKKLKNNDPLFQLFEHHLMTRSYEDAAVFTKEVADKYLAYLDSTSAHIPLNVRASISEDLELEAHEMLVKKMYGMTQSSEHHNYGKVMKMDREQVKAFEFLPPAPTEENPNKKR